MLLTVATAALLLSQPGDVGVVLLTRPTDLEGWPLAVRAQLSDLDAHVEERPAPDLPLDTAGQLDALRTMLHGTSLRLAVWSTSTPGNRLVVSVVDVESSRLLTRELPADSATLEALGQIVRASVLTLLSPPVVEPPESHWEVGAGWAAGAWLEASPWGQGAQVTAGWRAPAWYGAQGQLRVEGPLQRAREGVLARLQRFELQLSPSASWFWRNRVGFVVTAGVAVRLVRAEAETQSDLVVTPPVQWSLGVAAFAAVRPTVRLLGPVWLTLEAGVGVSLRRPSYHLDTEAGPVPLAAASVVEPRVGAGLQLRFPSGGQPRRATQVRFRGPQPPRRHE